MTSYRSPVTLGVCLVAVLPIALAGCENNSPATYPAGGKVVFADGTPLTTGTVELRSVDGRHRVVARGQIQTDGSFRLTTYRPNDGAVEGEHAALVAIPPPEGRIGDMKAIPAIIDPRFTQFDTSGLKCTVARKPAMNQFTFQVERARR